MPSESKFTHLETSTEGERLAAAKTLKARPNPDALIHRLKKGGEKKVRETEAATRKAKREDDAAKVRAKRLAFAKERARVAKEPKVDDFESYEVTGGEIESEKDEKKEEANLDRIFEAYEEANTVNDFMQFMLKNSDLLLTKERAESDPSIKQYLESKFDEEKTGLRYEDMVQALPSEEDYENNAHGQEVEEAEKTKKTKKIPSRLPPATATTARTVEDLNFIKNMKESGVGELEEAPKVEEAVTSPEVMKPAKFEDLEVGQEVMVERSKKGNEASGKIDSGWTVFRKFDVDKKVLVVKMENGKEISKAVSAEKIFVPVSNQNEELPPVSSEAEKLKSARTLVEAAAESAAKEEPFITPENIAESKRLAKKEARKSARGTRKFVASAEENEEAEIKNQVAAENKQWHEDKLEELSKALLQAWKEMGEKVTDDNKEDYLIKEPPSRFRSVFSPKARKVRNLYARYIKELK